MPRPGIRLKLLFGFGGLVIMLAVICYEGIAFLTQLGQSIDVIRRENYRSVAYQGMKVTMETMDGGKKSGIVAGTLAHRTCTKFQTETSPTTALKAKI
jgi:hypothetical protein